MNFKNGEIFLNLQGTPESKSICLSHGHGNYAYVSTADSFIHEFFCSISIWNGSTDTHESIEGNFYKQYELDCRDKKFFKSLSFKKMCEKHNIKLTIFDDNDDNQIIIDFWHQMKRK